MADQRSYNQYCPIAAALDVLGDRWTLLVLRELALVGPLRFTDLRRNLHSVPPNLLSDRLQTLAANGLVSTEELPPPAARTVYVLTEAGREALPVLRALARFGMPRLAPPDEAGMRPVSAVHATLKLYYDADAAEGVDEGYRVIVDGEPYDLSSLHGGGPARMVLTLTLSSTTLIALRQGRDTLAEAQAGGRLTVNGSKRALNTFARIFQLR